MNRSQGRSSREAVPGHRGVSNIPISGKGVDVEARFTGSHLKDEDVEDGEWEEYDKSKHEPLLLPDLRNLNVSDENIEHEQEAISVDPYTIEGLDKAKSLVNDFFREVNDWRMETGRDSLSPAQEDLYKGIRSHFSYLNGLIRSQKDLVEVDALELDEYGESLVANINLLIKMKELLLDAEVEQPESEIEQNKTGWWDKEFQKEQGISEVAGAAAVQRWGDQDGPIGFEPPQTESEEDKVRTGWWQDGYRNEQGYSETPIAEGKYIQRGALGVPNDAGSLEPDKLVSRPVPGRKGQVKWSLGDPESLSVEPALGEVPTPEQIVNEAIPEAASVVMEAAPLEAEKVSKPINPVYEQIRKDWVESKSAHESAHNRYNAAAVAYYESLNHESWGEKLLTRTKASFGFKPELPPEIAAMRDEMFAATERYNRFGRYLLEKRTLAGKESRGAVSNEVAQRYQRLLARSLVLNTFNEQRELQTAAAENLNFKPGKLSEFFKRNKKGIRLVGAVVVGAMSGAVVPAGVWWARATAGAAASAAATKFVGEKMDSKVSKVEADVRGEYEAKIDVITKRLAQGVLSSTELQDIYNDLSNMYYKVDVATQNRIMALVATAIGTGLLAGAAAGAATGMLGIGGVSPDASAGAFTDKFEGKGNILSSTAANAETVPTETLPKSELGDLDNRLAAAEKLAAEAQKMAEQSNIQETTPAAAYVAEKGDNLWDIMEGQTNAKELSVMEHVSESDKQRLIAEVVERINSDDALRAQVGFGDTADMLREGGEVNMAKLNEVAEAVAKENNISIESPETPPAPEAGAAQPEAAQTSEASLPAAATEAVAAQNAAESLIGTKVSPDQITRFALDYPKGLYPTGFQNFEQDFQTQWVDKIQGPTPASGGLFGFLFGSTPNSADAFKLFSSYSVGEFNELAKVDEAALASELTKNNIDMKDYLAWKDVMAQWQKEGLIIDPKDRFSYVAEAAFIKSLVPTPKP